MDETSTCINCHEEIFRRQPDSPWLTVYVNSANTAICTALCDEHECVNSSFVHIPKEDVDAEPEGPREYKVAEWALDDLRKRFERFTKRAATLGVEAPTFEIVRTEDEPVREIDEETGRWSDTGKVRRFHYITVHGQAPHFAGWKLLGVVERDVEESPDGPHLVHVLGEDVTVAPEWRFLGDVCDHCIDRGLTGARGRKTLVIITHEDGNETNETKVVGKSCLADFLGSNAPANLVQSIEWLSNLDSLLEATERDSEDDGEWRTRGEARIVADDYLAWVAVSIRTDGWVPRSFSGVGTATADAALRNQSWRPTQYDKVPPPSPEPQDIELAGKALGWAATLADAEDRWSESEYLQNLSIVAAKPAWRFKEIGLGASIISAYLKQQEIEIKRKERAAGRDAEKSSQWIGEPKQRIDIEGLVVFHKDFENQWGSTRLLKIHTTDGNVLTWWASTSCLEQGDRIKGKATVKEHDEYEGVKQTVIQRGKFEVVT